MELINIIANLTESQEVIIYNIIACVGVIMFSCKEILLIKRTKESLKSKKLDCDKYGLTNYKYKLRE